MSTSQQQEHPGESSPTGNNPIENFLIEQIAKLTGSNDFGLNSRVKRTLVKR